MKNLYDAFYQWAIRPDDERFSSIEEMLETCKNYADNAVKETVSAAKLEVVASRDNEVRLVGQSGTLSNLSFWAFGQLANKAQAPANYLRTLPASVAAACLNHGLDRLKGSKSTFELLFHKSDNTDQQLPLLETSNGHSFLLRAITSNKYKRIWNWEVVQEIQELRDQGWRVPPARPVNKSQNVTRKATKDDVLSGKGFGLSIKEGDPIAPAGLYASDHDMFAFLILENTRICDGTDGALSRGVFFENSEVGDRALRYTTYLYRHVCGNHIVWDVSDVRRTKIRHVGKAKEKFKTIFAEIKRFQNASAIKDENRIRKAQSKRLGKTQKEVIEVLFRRFYRNVTRQQLETAFDIAEENYPQDGDPHSAWGIAQGITRLSQNTPFGDERAKLDRTAGKVLRIAF